MTQRINYARRRSRKGRGLLPPNPNQWENEHNGLDLRDELTVALDTPLNHMLAFGLLKNVAVHPHGAIPAADVFLNRFRAGKSKGAWSGIGITTPDGFHLVFYNDSHPRNRVRSTLMEEFFHLWLDHPRSVLRVYTENGAHRSHDQLVESEAFGSGAAALLPYSPLKSMLKKQATIAAIGTHFRVSRDLVVFRAKVTKLYRYLRRQG